MSAPEKLPLLLVSDAPALPTGLARITRDLALRITEHIPEIDLAYLGWDYADEPFPWKNFPITDHDNWGRGDLAKVWWKAFGKRPGVVLTVWDPARAFALLEESGEVPAQLWGYFPIDGVNLNGTIGGPAAAAIRKYQRVLGYGAWGASVLARVLGAGRGRVEGIPHGLDLSVWRPRRAPEGLVGIVATNTHRKDWGLGFQAFREMRKVMPRLRLWCHVNSEVTVAWSLPELAEQCGLGAQDMIVTSSEKGGLPDDHLANLYSACVVTLGIGMGEGFGFPLVESLACGRPAVHCDYAGGAELIPVPTWRVRAKAFHVESAYALHRPVIAPESFAAAALAAAEWALAEPEVAEAYCTGSVKHLGWESLWPHWERWLREGIKDLEL